MDSTKGVVVSERKTSEEEASMAAIGMSSKADDVVVVPSSAADDDEREQTNEQYHGFEPTSYHPLLSPVVLPRVFDYVSGTGLKECRLVSREWNICSIPFMRRRVLVDLDEFGYDSDDDKEDPVQEFIKLMSSNRMGNPFGTYSIYPNDVDNEAFEKSGLTASISSLHLSTIHLESYTPIQRMATGLGGMTLKDLVVLVDDSVYFDWMNVISMFSHSLRSLSLDLTMSVVAGFRPWTGGPTQFPTMPNLTRLRLKLCTAPNHEIHSPPHRMLTFEDFGLTFPALRKLNLCILNRCIGFNEVIRRGRGGGSAVKTLCLRHVKLTLDVQNRILMTFPHLSQLTCDVGWRHGDQIIRQIWTQMRQLEELHIRGQLISDNLNSLLTGIPVQELSAMLSCQMIPRVEEEEDELTTTVRWLDPAVTKIQRQMVSKNMMDKYSQFPSIRNLTNLRSLSLHVTTYGRCEVTKTLKRNNPTDLTAFFGLYSIRTLRYLDVERCEFSKRGCQVLVNEMDLTCWRFGSRLHPIIPPSPNFNAKSERFYTD